MVKQRKSKRQLVRDERRKKKRDRELGDEEPREWKRQKGEDEDEPPPAEDDGREGLHWDRWQRIAGQKEAEPQHAAPAEPFYTDVGGGGWNRGPVGSQRGHAGSESRGDRGGFKDGRDFRGSAENGGYEGPEESYTAPDYSEENPAFSAAPEFFGLLSDAEQEYFRRADEMLEVNDFSSPDERRVFINSVFREARSKELKLISSQSCSRLVERLIQVASPRQKKRLFQAMQGHMLTLVTHRFASHCCEQLFQQSGSVVELETAALAAAEKKARKTKKGKTEKKEEDEKDGESAGNTEMVDAADGGGNDNDDDDDDMGDGSTIYPSMETLILQVLDELEADLPALLTDRFASHTLRVLLVVLAGRSLDGIGGKATRTLLHSKRKEGITAAAATAAPADTAVIPPPASFENAIRKILTDVAVALDGPALRILATHPTGNPVLQLLLQLELDMKRGKEGGHKGDKTDAQPNEAAPASLLDRLLPGAPASLGDPASAASDLVRSLIYDRIGSRLLETLITKSPGKVFKALYASMFARKESTDKDDKADTPFATYLRNDVACYPAMRMLERLSRQDLTDVIQQQVLASVVAPVDRLASTPDRRTKTISVITQLVERGRLSVLRTILERCQVRNVASEVVQALVQAIVDGVVTGRGGDAGEEAAGARRANYRHLNNIGQLITRLCLGEGGEEKKEGEGDEAKKEDKEKGADNNNKPSHSSLSVSPAAHHGCLLLASMLAIPGPPAAAAQAALLDLSGDDLARLATASPASARILIAALQTLPRPPPPPPASSSSLPSFTSTHNYRHIPPALHKQIVGRLIPHIFTLAISPAGHSVVEAIVLVPSRVGGAAADNGGPATNPSTVILPFHLKEAVVAQLAAHEDEVRDTWAGRASWRAWRGDLWRQRHAEWVLWAKTAEPDGLREAQTPLVKGRGKLEGERKTAWETEARRGENGWNESEQKGEEEEEEEKKKTREWGENGEKETEGKKEMKEKKEKKEKEKKEKKEKGKKEKEKKEKEKEKEKKEKGEKREKEKREKKEKRAKREGEGE